MFAFLLAEYRKSEDLIGHRDSSLRMDCNYPKNEKKMFISNRIMLQRKIRKKFIMHEKNVYYY